MEAPPVITIVQDLARCGLDPAGLTISFDELLQSTVVTVARKAGGNASGFTCIRSASWGKVEVTFEDDKLGAGYQSFSNAVGSTEARWLARHWLAERGLLERVPKFAIGTPPEEIATEIEKLCSIEPGKALELSSPNFVAVRPSFLKIPADQRIECLFNVMIAIDLEEHGLNFGFIGNQAFAGEGKR